MYQDLSLFKLPKGFRGRSAFIVQLWWFIQSTLFRFSPQFAYSFRRFLLRLFGAKIGSDVIIRPTVKVTYPWKLTVGDYAWVGDDVVIYSLGKVYIGENAVVSQRSYLCAGGHDYLDKSFPIYSNEIVIEREVWVATDVFIAPGVAIGRGSVIGARSSVFKSMPPGMVCFGSPCRPIKSR